MGQLVGSVKQRTIHLLAVSFTEQNTLLYVAVIVVVQEDDSDVEDALDDAELSPSSLFSSP